MNRSFTKMFFILTSLVLCTDVDAARAVGSKRTPTLSKVTTQSPFEEIRSKFESDFGIKLEIDTVENDLLAKEQIISLIREFDEEKIGPYTHAEILAEIKNRYSSIRVMPSTDFLPTLPVRQIWLATFESQCQFWDTIDETNGRIFNLDPLPNLKPSTISKTAESKTAKLTVYSNIVRYEVTCYIIDRRLLEQIHNVNDINRIAENHDFRQFIVQKYRNREFKGHERYVDGKFLSPSIIISIKFKDLLSTHPRGTYP